MQRAYDVVIIGGGVIGSSVAYHLSANPAFTGRVAVVERDPAYCRSLLLPLHECDPAAIRHRGQHPHVRLQHRLPAPRA